MAPRSHQLPLLILGAAIVISCAPVEPTQPSNILILLIDDFGVDMVGAYEEGTEPPPTPNIDRLASRGVLFRNAWSNPACSPTRAAIQTGRYAFRTGIGALVWPWGYALPLRELTLPKMLTLGTKGLYSTAAIGKWHLGNESVGGPHAPNEAGYQYFAGTLSNIEDYFAFEKTVNGTTRTVHRYATSEQVDDALAWIESTPPPWFCYLAFNGVHEPLHVPPEQLHSVELPGPYRPLGPQRPFYRAMVQALDHEIGRLLRQIGPEVLERTMVILIGDNGTESRVVVPPFDGQRAKATLYEGGINVPLIIAGPLVEEPGREVTALVDTTDVFSTVAEIAGVDTRSSERKAAGPIDSMSLVAYLTDPDAPSLRKRVYTESFEPNGLGPYARVDQAIRERRYKLIRTGSDGSEEFYDLVTDPFEKRNLLFGPPLSTEARAIYDELTSALLRVRTLSASPTS